MTTGITEFSAGFEYVENERGISVTRIFQFDPDSTADGPELPKPGDVLNADGCPVNPELVPPDVTFDGVWCRQRSWKSLAGHPQKKEWTITYSNEPVDWNVFDVSGEYTPPSISDLPISIEYSGEVTSINPGSETSLTGWKWLSDATPVKQPVFKRVNGSTLRVTVNIDDANYGNFQYAVRYLSGKLNDTKDPFGSDIGGGKGTWLFVSGASEMFRNYVSDKYWRCELEFVSRDPDDRDEDGWQKILRLNGIWDQPKDSTGAFLYNYGNFTALWDMTESPATAP